MKKLIAVFLISSTLFACKKDKADGDIPDDVEGYWTGTWSRTGNATKYEMAVILRDNNTVRILTGYSNGDTASAAYVTEDTYTYAEGVTRFESRESSFRYAYRGTASGSTMNGTWGTIPSEDNGGSWTMTLKR